MYETELYQRDIAMGDFIAQYQDIDKFMAYCRECPNYNTRWSCPSLSFEVGEMLAAFQNKTYNCTMLTFFSTKKLKVIAEEGMAWTIDGEHQDGIKTMDVTCHQHALQVLCPSKREALP